jgi:hypothetical protein
MLTDHARCLPLISLETPAQAAHTAVRFQTVDPNGGVVEWSIAPVLKTGVGKPTVGSNPTPSANTPARYSRAGVMAFPGGREPLRSTGFERRGEHREQNIPSAQRKLA